MSPKHDLPKLVEDQGVSSETFQLMMGWICALQLEKGSSAGGEQPGDIFKKSM